ncbi:hypothetical protein V9L05_12255 [Bernardetia sp. Wsw4-3y2]|uniref:hypothetical protein n=1 Tax=Bernardetia sp. Wsw4-3y2 TaxID=3127471 RepID=UPI0030CD81DA
MKIELNLDFTQLLLIIEQLPSSQKEKLIDLLTKNKTEDEINTSNPSKKRKLGGYEIYMSDDFDEPLSEFDEYSK